MNIPCVVDGCSRAAMSRDSRSLGMCEKHYRRERRRLAHEPVRCINIIGPLHKGDVLRAVGVPGPRGRWYIYGKDGPDIVIVNDASPLLVPVRMAFSEREIRNNFFYDEEGFGTQVAPQRNREWCEEITA